MTSPLQILHLEDNDLDAELIQSTLEADGVSAVWQRVQKRDDFVAALQAAPPDLILADYALPAFDGLSALALAQTHSPQVPFIFVSGALGEERAIEAFKRGATDYVIKTHLHRLAPAVRRAVREANEHRDRQRAEVMLRGSEERYRSLVAATTTLVWHTDAQGHMVEPNPDWEAYTGQAWPAYAGDGWLSAVHPDDRAGIAALWAESIARPGLYNSQSRLWHAASNSYHYYNSNGVPLLDAEGKVREWIGTATDIHESKLAQQKIEEAAERTSRSQAIIAELSQALTPSEVVKTIVQQGLTLVEAAGGAVTLLNPEGTALDLIGTSGYLENSLEPWQRIPLNSESPAAQVAGTRQPLWIDSQAAYVARFPQMAVAPGNSQFEARAILPLVFEDRLLGTLGFSFVTIKTFTQVERDALLTLARQCAQALERARLFESERLAKAEAQALNVQLEARVGERTAQLEAVLLELRAANAELEKEISERRQAEARIRESERRLAEAQHLARLGSWYWDLENNVVNWSEQMYRIYGLQPDSNPVRYEDYVDRIHPEDRAVSQAMINRAIEEHGSFSYDHRISLPSGEVRTVHAQGEAIEDVNGKLIAMSGTGQDITDRKEIEEELRSSREQLRQLSGYLQAAREEERSRISREIHDQFGGALTALKMDIRQIQRVLKDPQPSPADQAKLQTRLDSMAELIDATAKTIRRIAADLRPGILDDLGLEAAIEWQLNEFQTRSGIHCALSLQVNDLSLDSSGSTALFRVFQETLTNVARHSQATQVEVSLSQQDEYVILRVSDNGRGISPQEMAGSHSLGLVGMRERVGLLSGDLNIQGRPGEGTTILARIPLKPPNSASMPVPEL